VYSDTQKVGEEERKKKKREKKSLEHPCTHVGPRTGLDTVVKRIIPNPHR
jgi:hypothetical protein